MITIEKYASVYTPMIMAAGDATKEKSIATENGISHEEWKEAQTYYTAKMMDISDMGKTAMAFAAAFQNNTATANSATQTPAEADSPSSFSATDVKIYISEYDVQMIEFINTLNKKRVTLQMSFEFDEAQKGFGGDTFYITINNANYSTYGGIKQVILTRYSVKFVFDEVGQAKMKTNDITVAFAVNKKYYNYLVRKMEFIFGSIDLQVENPTDESNIKVGNMDLDETYQEKTMSPNQNNADAFTIRGRVNLKNVLEKNNLKNYVTVVYPTNGVAEGNTRTQILNFEQSLTDTLERDLQSVIAFTFNGTAQYVWHIYTNDPDEFMKRLNEATRLLPKLPIELGKNEDPEFSNYARFVADIM